MSNRFRVVVFVFAFLGLAAYGLVVAWLMNGGHLCFSCVLSR